MSRRPELMSDEQIERALNRLSDEEIGIIFRAYFNLPFGADRFVVGEMIHQAAKFYFEDRMRRSQP